MHAVIQIAYMYMYNNQIPLLYVTVVRYGFILLIQNVYSLCIYCCFAVVVLTLPTIVWSIIIMY